MRKQVKHLLKYFFTIWFLFRKRNIINVKLGINSTFIKCQVTGLMGGVKLGDNTSLKACTFVFKGRGNKIVIGDNVRLSGVTFWFEDDGNEIVIGDGTTMEGNNQLAACEGTRIVIGKDCMFARNVNLRTTDSHSIVNDDGKRINLAKDIIIGNHVWIGTDVLVLKGAYIPDNCVVSAKALVAAHKYEQNSIIGGVPAKKIKCDVNWLRERI